MRKTLTALAASAGLMLSLTACGQSAEDKYVADLRDHMPAQTASASDTELIEVGEAACDVLDSGISVGELAMALALDPSLDHELAGAITGHAVRNLCPEHEDQMNDFLGTSSA